MSYKGTDASSSETGRLSCERGRSEAIYLIMSLTHGKNPTSNPWSATTTHPHAPRLDRWNYPLANFWPASSVPIPPINLANLLPDCHSETADRLYSQCRIVGWHSEASRAQRVSQGFQGSLLARLCLMVPASFNHSSEGLKDLHCVHHAHHYNGSGHVPSKTEGHTFCIVARMLQMKAGGINTNARERLQDSYSAV